MGAFADVIGARPMNDQPTPQAIASALVDQYGSAALDVALNRVATAQQLGGMKAHDHALMVLTEVERVVANSDNEPPSLH